MLRSWAAREHAAAVAGAVALLFGSTGAWLLTRTPTGNCGTEVAASPDVRRIRATKVVVQPWLGKHRVYAIFMVPDTYQDHSKFSASMTVGRHQFAAALWPRRQHLDGVAAEQGHHLLRGYVSTRTALWFLVTGRFGDLQSCDWTLVLVDRAS
jgi:hypothetical protein